MIEPVPGASTVLIIDDDETVLSVTQQIVMRAGFCTAVASSGREGVSVLERQIDEVSCILLDMSMPGMDGLETFRVLRRIKPEVPIIIVSGYSDRDMRETFGDNRPFAFVQKPYSISELDGLLHKAIGRQQRRKKTPTTYTHPILTPPPQLASS